MYNSFVIRVMVKVRGLLHVVSNRNLIEESYIYGLYDKYLNKLEDNFNNIGNSMITTYRKSMVYNAIGGSQILKLLACVFTMDLGLILAIVTLPFLDYMFVLIYMAIIIGIYLSRALFGSIRPLRKDPMDIPIILFGILILISTITSIEVYGSLRDLIFHLISIGFTFVLANSINSKEDFNRIVLVLIATASIVGVVGLFQYRLGVKMEGGWVDLARNPGIDTRIYSVLDNPNILAEYLVMIIPISLALFWYCRGIRRKALFLMSSSILALSLALTLSRGGLMGLAAGLLVFMVLVGKRLLPYTIPLAIIMIYFLPERIFNRLLSIGDLRDSSNAYRLAMWRVALPIIRDNWLVGVGLGYIPFRLIYKSYVSNMETYHIHNTYLQILGEMGIVGLMVFLLLIFTLFKYSIKRLVRGEDRYIGIMAGGLLSGLAGILIHGSVESILFMPKIIATFWMLVGLLLALMRISRDKGEID